MYSALTMAKAEQLKWEDHQPAAAVTPISWRRYNCAGAHLWNVKCLQSTIIAVLSFSTPHILLLNQLINLTTDASSAAKLDRSCWTVVRKVHSPLSVQQLSSIHMLVNANKASRTTACCYGNNSPKHWKTPKAPSTLTGKMLKCKSNQAYLSLFSWRWDLKFVWENNQANVNVRSGVNNQQQQHQETAANLPADYQLFYQGVIRRGAG